MAGPVEGTSAKELKKALRRLKHGGAGAGDEASQLEARLATRVAWENDLASTKGADAARVSTDRGDPAGAGAAAPRGRARRRRSGGVAAGGPRGAAAGPVAGGVARP